MPEPRLAVSLKLAYDFTPRPNPIRASAQGANPNVVELQIVISNPSRESVPMSKITIDIPLGQDVSRDLSTNTSLPSPLYDTTGPWSISTERGTVTIVPKDGDEGQVTAPIILSLPGIVVNQVAGEVPLAVSEFPHPSDPKVEDKATYKLYKQPADYPVTDFRAEPAVVTDLEQKVTLHWTCSDRGKGLAYGLRASIRVAASEEHPNGGGRRFADAAPDARAADSPFRSCVADGNCYTWQDGVNGVVTPVVNQTTAFALDIVQAESGGHGTVIASLTTTVDVTVPWISQNSYVKSYLGGRVLGLHWLAFNAGYCSVQVDGVVVDDAAPTDTYHKGYLVVPPDGDGPHTPAVIAHAAVGSAVADHTFPQQQRITPVTWIDNVYDPSAIAVTPDGAFALVANKTHGDTPPSPFQSSVTVIDVRARRAEQATLFIGPEVKGRMDIAITPDGRLALVTTGDGIRVIDVPGRNVEPASIPVGQVWSIAITPDGKTALAGAEDGIHVVNIAGRKLETTIPIARGAIGIAITPDGTLAFALNRSENTWWQDVGSVTVIDLATRAAERTIEFEQVLMESDPIAPRRGIAITPDGALAFVATLGGDVAVIDVATRTVEANPIGVGGVPDAIAMSSDGPLALTTHFGRNKRSVTIIDVARRAALTLAWYADVAGPAGITQDGRTALAAAFDDDEYLYGKVGLI